MESRFAAIEQLGLLIFIVAIFAVTMWIWLAPITSDAAYRTASQEFIEEVNTHLANVVRSDPEVRNNDQLQIKLEAYRAAAIDHDQPDVVKLLDDVGRSAKAVEGTKCPLDSRVLVCQQYFMAVAPFTTKD